MEKKKEAIRREAYERGFRGWEIDLIIYKIEHSYEGWLWLNA